MVKCHLKAGRNTLLYTNFTIAPEIEDSGNCVPGVLPHFLYMDFLKRLDEGCLLLLIEVFNDTDRKSTRLNSSHVSSWYAGCCVKKKRRESGDAAERTR